MNLRRPAELFENLTLPHRLRPPQSYMFVLLLVVLGTLVRWGMPKVLESTHFLAFYPVVVFAAMLGGFGPGVLAIALSWVSVSLFFDYTPGTLSLGHRQSWASPRLCRWRTRSHCSVGSTAAGEGAAGAAGTGAHVAYPADQSGPIYHPRPARPHHALE